MNSEELFEAPTLGNTLGTHLRSFGARARDAALSTFGSNKARGRLSIRLITNKLMRDFMMYVGGQGINPITDQTVRDYVSRYYQPALQSLEPVIQQTVGNNAAPATNPTPANPTVGGPNQPMNARGQQVPVGANGWPSGTGTWAQQASSPQTISLGRTQLGPNASGTRNWTQPTTQTAPPPAATTYPQSTPDQMRRYVRYKTLFRQAASRPDVDPKKVSALLTGLLKTASGAQNLRVDARRFVDELRSRPDVLSRVPEIAKLGDDPFANLPTRRKPATTAANQPAPAPVPNQPIAASQAPATPAIDDLTIPHVPGQEPLQPNMQPQVPAFLQRQDNNGNPISSSTPTAANAPDDLTIPSVPTGTTGAPPPSGPAVPDFLKRQRNTHEPQAAPQAAAPTVKPASQHEQNQFIHSLHDELEQHPPGSHEHDQTVMKIRRMLGEPSYLQRYPMLRNFLKRESRLIEAVSLQRSQIDTIFQGLARILNASGQASATRRSAPAAHAAASGGPGHAATGAGSHSWAPSHVNASAIMNTTITPQSLEAAKNDQHMYGNVQINANDWATISNAVGQGKPVKDVLRNIRTSSPGIMVALLYAAEYGH